MLWYPLSINTRIPAKHSGCCSHMHNAIECHRANGVLVEVELTKRYELDAHPGSKFCFEFIEEKNWIAYNSVSS